MAVKTCRLKTQELRAGLDNDNRLSMTYHIDTDGVQSLWDIMLQCQTATPNPIPRRYTYVGFGMYILEVAISQRNTDSRTTYVARVECGPLPPGKDLETLVADPEGYLEKPLERQLVVTVEADEYSRLLKNEDLATGSNKLKTTADEPFGVPPEGQFIRSILTVRRNVEFWSIIDAVNQTYQNTRNSDSFLVLGRSVAVNSLHFLSCTGEPINENNTRYYRATLRFQRIKVVDYQVPIVNRGYKVRPAAGQPAIWAEDEGQRVPEPVLLAADGTRLADGADPTNVTITLWPPKVYAPLFAAGVLDEGDLPA